MHEWPLPVDRFIPVDPDVVVKPSGESGFTLCTSSAGGVLELIDTPGCMGGIALRADRYLVMDVQHDSHDVLVIIVEFGQQGGTRTEDRVAVHFGILPGVVTRLCLPLAALTAERLFLPRYPGVMQTVLRGGAGILPERVDTLRLGTIASTRSRTVHVQCLYVTDEEPAFPAVPVAFCDELGQLKQRNWPGKTPTVADLQSYLQDERARLEQSEFFEQMWSPYGGWKELRFEATGYFRTQHDGRRWWLVDPDGYAYVSTGFDCVQPGEAMKVRGMAHLTEWLPSRTGEFTDAWGGDQNANDFFSYAVANLIRAFKTDWWSAWSTMTRRRLREWGFNTVAAWSNPRFVKEAGMPYVWNLRDFPATQETIFRDFPDVYSEEYRQSAQQFAQQLKDFSGDRLLLGYFLRNEPHWAFVENVNLAEKLLRHPRLLHSKEQFVTRMMTKYEGSIERFNASWETEFSSFASLQQPLSMDFHFTLEARQDLDNFTREMIDEYVRIPAQACKRVDPHHLNLGMRYAWISSPHLLLAGRDYFDVFSINCYQMRPDVTVIDQIEKATGLPVMLGEFHHGAADVGMLASGIRGVATQADRGQAYRYFVEQGIAMPSVVGMHYFLYNDQALLGRFDGENYQIGAVDVCHRPYQPFVDGAKQAHRRMYAVAAGQLAPLDSPPREIPKTGF